MKLRRLAIERLPGIDRPFELGELEDGLNIIVGPNGIGKSRLCGAVRALLWRERALLRDPHDLTDLLERERIGLLTRIDAETMMDDRLFNLR